MSKKIRNIVPIPSGGKIVEPGTVFVYNVATDRYEATVHPLVVCANATQAADPRLFEPVEEPWPEDCERVLVINHACSATSIIYGEIMWSREHAIGNCFHPDSKVNQYGVHIDDARKVFLLALRANDFAQDVLSAIREWKMFDTNAHARDVLLEIEKEQGDE